MNLNKLEELSSRFETLDFDIDDLEKETSKEFTAAIVKAAKDEVKPTDEDGEKIVKFGTIIRNFGNRLLNLLKIEFSVSFAGVTLIHFTIPKIENKQNK